MFDFKDGLKIPAEPDQPGMDPTIIKPVDSDSGG